MVTECCAPNTSPDRYALYLGGEGRGFGEVVGKGRGEEVGVERIISSQSPDKVWVSVPHRTTLGEMPGGPGRRIVSLLTPTCFYVHCIYAPHL